MKIISWNVNGIRASYKKGLVEFVERESPDVFCVQETKALREQVGPEISEMNNMFSYWSSAERKGYSGTATFVQESLESVEHGIGIKKFDSEGRFVVTDHADFLLYNIYFPNGASGPDRHDYKMDFLKNLNSHLAEKISEGREVIVLGDYNVAPSKIDIYDPIRHENTSGFRPVEREWFQSFIKLGFVDTFRHFYPDETQRYTWWNQIERARLANRGWRIDLVCITEGLVERLQAAAIFEDVEGSDHCPIGIEIEA
jgi:exodeoxyribonuclease-3